jgi:4-amino-4-deoxy-L-arabinose transferase-like glycosyltransferase
MRSDGSGGLDYIARPMRPPRRIAQRFDDLLQPFRFDRITAIALAAIVALGLSLRLAGISYGLPFHHHWDEGWIVDSAAGMLRHHDIVPASYQHGAPLMVLTKWAFLVWRFFARHDDGFTSEDAHVTLFLIGRVVTAVITTTGIVGIAVAAHHSTAEPAARRLRALAAALLYAVAPQIVVHARYAMTDANLVATTAWTLAFAAIYVTTEEPLYGFLSAGAAGVTCAFKMPGVVASTIPLAAAGILVLRGWKSGGPQRAHRVLLLSVVPIVAATYVLLNPHIVDRHDAALHDMTIRYLQVKEGRYSKVYVRAAGLPHLAAALYAIVTAFTSRSAVVATTTFLVATFGWVQDLRRRNAVTAIAVLYGVALVLAGALPNRTFLYRNYIVVTDVIALGFAAAVAYAFAFVRLRRERLGRLGLGACALAGGALVAALVGLPIHDAWAAHARRLDPRIEAVNWIDAHAEGGATVAATRTVFDPSALASYEQLPRLVEPITSKLVASDLDACPDPASGPRYLIDASNRDPKRAAAGDPLVDQWLFEACPGYREVARFGENPYEADLDAYPTWIGRVTAIVLQREK